MNLVSNFLIKEPELIKEAFSYVSKYSSDELIITDKKFNIIFHNSKYIKGSGINLSDIADNFLNNNIKNNIEEFKISDKNHLYIKMILNSENELSNIPADIHICKIKNTKKQIRGYLIIIRDITQEIRNKIQRETFIDILSHDLRNPIRANVQILELILNNKFGEINSNLKVILDELLNSCRFMNYMAENLLIKYKNEFNLYELHKQKYSIVKLIKDKCNAMVNILNRKHQTIEFIINGNIHEIEMDINEIGKVINNLIVNASEQSSENSKIIIQIENNKENVNVSFIDCGYTRKTDNPNEIFEEYITCTNRFRKVGFSLELYNCRKIIEAHNGTISAENANNKGTAITFCLPTFS